MTKKIGMKELNKITREDVYKVIERWDADEKSELRESKHKARKYYLYLNGKPYSSKSVLAWAYEVHSGRVVHAAELKGGKKDTCKQLRDELGFEIILKDEKCEYKKFSWISQNESVMLKKVGKYFLGNQGFIIKKERSFFDAEKLGVGDKKDICFYYQNKPYGGWVKIDSFGYARLFWSEELGEHFNICHEEAKKHLSNLSIRFQRIAEGKYSVQFLDEGIIADEKEELYETIVSQKEGKKKEYYVTRYERNSINRENAIKFHGTECNICGFDFAEFYREAGRNFIEVHHIKPLSEAEENIEVNPETDLICLCANCHSIIHRRRDKVYSIEEMKDMVNRCGHWRKRIKDDKRK